RDEEVWRRWLGCRWVRDFQRGRCSPEDFAAGVVDDWALPVDAETFLAGFRSWVSEPMPGADALVRRVRRTVPVGCLSNTNAVHWDECAAGWALLEGMDFRFLSFEMGVIKPDREMFDRVAEGLQVAPGRVL